MKRPIHHQTVGARRAVPLVQTSTPVGQEIGHGIGHGTPCRYGGDIKSHFQKRYTKGTGSGTARRAPTAGFTLVELVVVIVIVGILSALGGQFIVAPITGYVDLSRRAKLVDQAEMALRRMQRDIRTALPNSIPSVTGASSISFETTIDGGRYRRYPGGGYDNILDFTKENDSFEMLSLPSKNTWDSLDEGKQLDVVVYNTSPNTTDNRRGIAGITKTHPYIVSLESDEPFPLSSPQQRFFIVDRDKSSVTYSCGGGELTRNGVLLAGNVDNCNFTYSPGTTQRAGLVTMRLTLEEQGEQITLLHQVHVVNAP